MQNLTIESDPSVKFARSAGQYDFRKKLAILRNHVDSLNFNHKKLLVMKSRKTKLDSAGYNSAQISIMNF